MQNRRHVRMLVAGLVLLTILLCCLSGIAQTTSGVAAFVNPFIGTTVSDVPTRWGNEGGCYPGAVAVHGSIQLTPETRHASTSGYDFRDSSILFFSCLHHNSGFPGGSAGDVYLMPVRPDTGFHVFQTRRPFRHSGETASPGYYRVRLTDDSTEVEAAAGTRAGLFRIRFPRGVFPAVFLGDPGGLILSGDSAVSGQRDHFLAKFNHPVTGAEKISNGLLLRFAPAEKSETEIIIRVAASGVSDAGSAANMEAEVPAWLSFDSLRKRTSKSWERTLSVITVNDPDTAAQKIFYTALYHAMLIPEIISDVNGNYRGHDGEVHRSENRDEYGIFSPWDTYRTLNPLRALLYPETEKAIALSIFDIWKQTGRLPVESMTGNHAIAILADDYEKGILPVDKSELFRALQSNVTDSPFVQRDMTAYTRDGYLSAAWPESVTRTVEYGYNDWVLAQFAGKEMQDQRAERKYALRSLGYRKLFDPQARLLLPKDGNRFLDHAGTTGYKEGDAWTYTYNVPQDTKGLSNLMGGASSFVLALDSALADGRIYFDNETVFHIPWLFTEAGAPQATRYWIDRLRRERFHDTPGGLPGNDDLGSLSAWYVWSALGFYPLTPGRPLYTIASPLFREMTIHPDGNRTLIIKRDSAAIPDGAIRRNNLPYLATTVSHDQLKEGAVWLFGYRRGDSLTRSERVRVQRDTNANAYPFSLTKRGPKILVTLGRLSRPRVKTDELFRIPFSARNSGATGSVQLAAMDGEQMLGSALILVDSGGTVRGELECRAYQAGNRTVTINGRIFSLRVDLRRSPADRAYQITELQAKALVRDKEEQHYSFRIKNTGGIKRRFTVPVIWNSTQSDTLFTVLKPGESTRLTGKARMSGPGIKSLQVGDARFDFRVYRKPEEAVLLDLKWAGMPVSADTVNLTDRSGFGNKAEWISGRKYSPQISGENEGAPVGEGSYIRVASSPGLDIMDSNLTMMTWIFPAVNAPGLADIFSKGDHHVLQLAGNNRVSFFAGGWGRGDCTVALPENWTGHWHHLAGVCEGRWLRLYIDGVEAGSTLTDEPVNLSIENHWNLGRNEEFPGIRMFNGRLDFIRVYAEALSPAGIRAEMERETPKGVSAAAAVSPVR